MRVFLRAYFEPCFVCRGSFLSSELREILENTVLKNATVLTENGFEKLNITVSDGKIISLSDSSLVPSKTFDFSNCYIFPGFVDVHVHFREPGFVYKECIASGSRAAAHGGYTTVFTMPNLNPVPDCLQNLKPQLDAIKKDSVIKVIPYGSISVSELGRELSKLHELAPYVSAFSDDGKGVQDDGLMREAMLTAKELNKVICAHCEVNSLLNGGYIHKGGYALKNGHAGISSESEWRQIERDIKLAAETGCAYHVCHISAKESVSLIRDAKKSGVDITCETAPHYLVLCDEDLKEEGRFKMNPPLRGREDKEALLLGIEDGTIDMIATDHAPHSAEEKAKGLKGSPFGITGIETAFPLLYTKLVKPGVFSLEKIIKLLTENPAKRFGLESGIREGVKADLTVFSLDEEITVDDDFFLSMGKSSPFLGERLYGKCLMTLCEGEVAYRDR